MFVPHHLFGNARGDPLPLAVQSFLKHYTVASRKKYRMTIQSKALLNLPAAFASASQSADPSVGGGMLANLRRAQLISRLPPHLQSSGLGDRSGQLFGKHSLCNCLFNNCPKAFTSPPHLSPPTVWTSPKKKWLAIFLLLLVHKQSGVRFIMSASSWLRRASPATWGSCSIYWWVG